MRNGSKGIEIPLKSLYGHLPEILSHTSLQKVRGYIDEFTWLRNGATSAPKILLPSWVVKGKIAFENSFGLQAQIEDLPLKCGTEKENPKNNISGSTFLFHRKSVLGSKINASRSEALGVFGKIPTSPGRR
jgi:hypothetical protein